jgi:hypothetical protein
LHCAPAERQQAPTTHAEDIHVDTISEDYPTLSDEESNAEANNSRRALLETRTRILSTFPSLVQRTNKAMTELQPFKVDIDNLISDMTKIINAARSIDVEAISSTLAQILASLSELQSFLALNEIKSLSILLRKHDDKMRILSGMKSINLDTVFSRCESQVFRYKNLYERLYAPTPNFKESKIESYKLEIEVAKNNLSQYPSLDGIYAYMSDSEFLASLRETQKNLSGNLSSLNELLDFSEESLPKLVSSVYSIYNYLYRMQKNTDYLANIKTSLETALAELGEFQASLPSTEAIENLKTVELIRNQEEEQREQYDGGIKDLAKLKSETEAFMNQVSEEFKKIGRLEFQVTNPFHSSSKFMLPFEWDDGFLKNISRDQIEKIFSVFKSDVNRYLKYRDELEKVKDVIDVAIGKITWHMRDV